MCQIVSFLWASYSVYYLSGIALFLIPCNCTHLLLSWPIVIYLLRPISSITSSGFCDDLLSIPRLYPLQGLCFQTLNHFYILSA